MRRKMTLQNLSTASDGAGGLTTAWSTVKTVFGDVKVEEGQRININDREYVGITYRVKVRTQTLNYTVPIENYRFIFNTYGLNLYLKPLYLKNKDMVKFFTELVCIAEDGGGQ